MQQINMVHQNYQTSTKTSANQALLRQLIVLLLCLLVVLSSSACGRTVSEGNAESGNVSDKQKSDDDDQPKKVEQSDEATEPEENAEESEENGEVSEEESSDNSGIGPIVAWPDTAPDNVPELKNANITAVIPSSGSLTMMFETNDMDLIKSYIDELGKEGFEQASLSENKFGLDYFGSKDGVSVFINFVVGGLSKLTIEY